MEEGHPSAQERRLRSTQTSEICISVLAKIIKFEQTKGAPDLFGTIFIT